MTEERPQTWTWARIVGARRCPECHGGGCDDCQMTGWEGGREP